MLAYILSIAVTPKHFTPPPLLNHRHLCQPHPLLSHRHTPAFVVEHTRGVGQGQGKARLALRPTGARSGWRVTLILTTGMTISCNCGGGGYIRQENDFQLNACIGIVECGDVNPCLDANVQLCNLLIYSYIDMHTPTPSMHGETHARASIVQ